MARTDPQVNFRIPADLLDRVKAAAVRNNRTITAELVARLEQSFSSREDYKEVAAYIIDTMVRAGLMRPTGITEGEARKNIQNNPPKALDLPAVGDSPETLIHAHRTVELEAVRTEIQAKVEEAHQLAIAGNTGEDYQKIRQRLAELRRLELHLLHDHDDIHGSIYIDQLARGEDIDDLDPPKASKK